MSGHAHMDADPEARVESACVHACKRARQRVCACEQTGVCTRVRVCDRARKCAVHGLLASGMGGDGWGWVGMGGDGWGWVGMVVHKVSLSLEACCMDLPTLTQMLTQRYAMEWNMIKQTEQPPNPTALMQRCVQCAPSYLLSLNRAST